MVLNHWKILENLNEKELFNLCKNYYKDLVDLNLEDDKTAIDWYIPSLDTYVESKCRKKAFPTYYIEKDKYDKLMQVEKSWYLNSTPTGIYFWVVQDLELDWYERYMTNTQEFGEQKYVKKLVADLLIKDAMQIEHLLFI